MATLAVPHVHPSNAPQHVSHEKIDLQEQKGFLTKVFRKVQECSPPPLHPKKLSVRGLMEAGVAMSPNTIRRRKVSKHEI